jgi:hypothetical protein
VAAVLDRPSWVIDADYERGRSPGGWSGDTKLGDMVLERADTAVWLDLPLRVSLERMWTRTTGRVRDQAAGTHETWRLDLLRWAQWEVRSHLRRRTKTPRRLARHSHVSVVHLRSQREVVEWLARQRRR